MKNIIFSFILLFGLFGFTTKAKYKPIHKINVIIKNNPGDIAFNDLTNRRGVISTKLNEGNYTLILFKSGLEQAMTRYDKDYVKHKNNWIISLKLEGKDIKLSNGYPVESISISPNNDNNIDFIVPAAGTEILIKVCFTRTPLVQKHLIYKFQ